MEVTIILLNFVYAMVGAFATIAFMAMGYAVFDRLTPFDTHAELA